MDAWADDLRVTPKAIRAQKIFVASGASDDARVGFFGWRHDGAAWRLDHFWLAPENIGRGYGRALFSAALAEARRLGIACFQIESDPHAEGFYLRMGARRTGVARSMLLGKYPRELPRLAFDVPSSP